MIGENVLNFMFGPDKKQKKQTESYQDEYRDDLYFPRTSSFQNLDINAIDPQTWRVKSFGLHFHTTKRY